MIGRSSVIRLNELVADNLPVAFLVINRIYEEMKRLPDATRQGPTVNLRHVLFIDEAHHYFPIRTSPLTGLIREGRSKGIVTILATQSISDLTTASGADYREFLSNIFFFKSNISGVSEIRGLFPTSARKVQSVADLLPSLGPGRMLFSRHLEGGINNCIINAAQYFRRQPV